MTVDKSNRNKKQAYYINHQNFIVDVTKFSLIDVDIEFTDRVK